MLRLSTPHQNSRLRPLAEVRNVRGQGGFSLIEVLLASVMLLIIALGIVPMFVRSVGLNAEGRMASVSTSLAADEIERLVGMPFDGPEMTIPPGSFERVVDQYQLEPRGDWIDESAYTGGGFAYHRIVRIRQFNFNALNDKLDQVLEEAEALDGDALASLVQMKEIVVQVQSGNFVGGNSRAVTLRYVRGV